MDQRAALLSLTAFAWRLGVMSCLMKLNRIYLVGLETDDHSSTFGPCDHR
jgi:hypothetical protein